MNSAVAVSTSNTACVQQHVGSAGAGGAAAAAAAGNRGAVARKESCYRPARVQVTAIEHGGAGSVGFPAPYYWLSLDRCVTYAQPRAHCLKMRKYR